MTQLKQELIPSIELPQVSIVTAIPGASPEVVDEQVSEPISQAVGELSDVEKSWLNRRRICPWLPSPTNTVPTPTSSSPQLTLP